MAFLPFPFLRALKVQWVRRVKQAHRVLKEIEVVEVLVEKWEHREQ
jgi:hypothetical protein